MQAQREGERERVKGTNLSEQKISFTLYTHTKTCLDTTNSRVRDREILEFLLFKYEIPGFAFVTVYNVCL